MPSSRPPAPAPAADAEADLAALYAGLVTCRRCPRLVAWREAAAGKRRAYAEEPYWARPVPGFGDPRAWLLIVGLAPGAHGSNRTGRMFTGDASGDFLFAALHRAGLASQPAGRAADDGLALLGAYLTAAVRCAPPDNRPAPAEWAACRPYLERELALLGQVRVIVALGAFAWERVLAVLAAAGQAPPTPRPRFGHGAEARLGPYRLLGSYHPSQQNTFTGRLTAPMFDRIWQRARELGAEPDSGPR
jgi:uracil-DNA glycosylase family 4